MRSSGRYYRMQNNELAHISHKIAIFLKIRNNHFKPRVLEKVASALDGSDRPVAKIYGEGGVKEPRKIPTVDEAIAGKMGDLI
jgi:DNA polymerase/3'-5' exonuclease PolX